MVVIVSIVICAIISLALSYYLALFILGLNSSLFKIAQLIVAIVSMTTFYAPIKHILLKYMEVEDNKSENEND
jgi:hypothetical protein